MSTVNIKINGYDYTMKKGITILDASFETLKMQREFMQQSIPTLYYLKGVQDVDQSGVCIAEVDGEIVNASTTRIKDPDKNPGCYGSQKESTGSNSGAAQQILSVLFPFHKL